MIESESKVICIWLAERLPKDTFGLVLNSVTGFDCSSLSAFFYPDWAADPLFFCLMSKCWVGNTGSFPDCASFIRASRISFFRCSKKFFWISSLYTCTFGLTRTTASDDVGIVLGGYDGFPARTSYVVSSVTEAMVSIAGNGTAFFCAATSLSVETEMGLTKLS